MGLNPGNPHVPHSRAVRAPLRATIAVVPLYEFECGWCGARFEDLVSVGTETLDCRECGAEGAGLHGRTKRDFKARRAAARGKGPS